MDGQWRVPHSDNIIMTLLEFNVFPKHEPMQVQALDDDAENTDNQKFTLRHAVGSLVRYV